jgi:hypothetical protein
MNRIALGAALALIAVNTTNAQHAVQWRVEDGGNGHWYQFVRDVPTQFLQWTTARERSVAVGVCPTDTTR